MTPRLFKAIGKGAHRFLAVYKSGRGGGGTAEPVERRAKGRFTIEPGETGGAKDGDLVWVETKNARGYGPQKARVRDIAGHVDDKNAFSTIALANHGIPTDFPAGGSGGSKESKAPRSWFSRRFARHATIHNRPS